MSKYARQIFQAMRPVFADMASEIQRSLGYYSSSNPDTKLKYIIAFGGGAKLQGLLKYFQQTLQIQVESPDTFKNLKLSDDVSAAKFHENVADFGIVYGLGLQVLGAGKIESNLLPTSLARSMAWAAKAKFFIAAACIFLVVAMLSFARTSLDKMNYQKQASVRSANNSVVSLAQQGQEAVSTQAARATDSQATIDKQLELFKYRQIIPFLRQTLIQCLPNENNNPSQKALYEAFKRGDIDTIMKFPRKERKQVFITTMSIDFSSDLETATFRPVPFTSGTSASAYSNPQAYNSTPAATEPAAQIDPATNEPIAAEVPAIPIGFVVSIAGYSPYGDIGQLLDPIGIGEDQSQWGMVTRLMHLDEIVDGNSPFTLYKKGNISHCRIEKGTVSFEESIPAGIGQPLEKIIILPKAPKTSEPLKRMFLVDPMTKETINKFAVLDETGANKMDRGRVVYELHDNWFKLDLKFVWKEAPVMPMAAAATGEVVE